MGLGKRIFVAALAGSMALAPNLVLAQQQRQGDGRDAGTGAARVTRGTFGGMGLTQGELVTLVLMLGAVGTVAFLVANGGSSGSGSGSGTGQ